MEDGSVSLPPGFRFDPTDEELILHFLYCKAACLHSDPDVIPYLDLYAFGPWELNGKALLSCHKWYFFSRMTENRVTENGYWKQVDIDEPIFTSAGKKVGIKKCLVFYIGEVPTDWIMQEYRLYNSGLISKSCKRRRENQKVDSDDWVLCRVHKRDSNSPGSTYCHDDNEDGVELSSLDEVFLSLMDDDLDEISFPN